MNVLRRPPVARPPGALEYQAQLPGGHPGGYTATVDWFGIVAWTGGLRLCGDRSLIEATVQLSFAWHAYSSILRQCDSALGRGLRL